MARPGKRIGSMTERYTDCRNLAAYFYKRWQRLLRSNSPEDQDRALDFEDAFRSAIKWLYEYTDVPQANIAELIRNDPDGAKLPIAAARIALDELDKNGLNVRLLEFMWQHYPEQCAALELPKANVQPPIQLPLSRDNLPLEHPLSQRQHYILAALRKVGAIDDAHLVKTATIAELAEGKGSDPAAFKEPISALVKMGLVATKEGRGGGAWLTSSGVQKAESAKL
jgi:hypothetical protein